MAADPTMATGPFLAANMAPVRAPLVMEFQGSSFPLILTILQSIMEKRPPQTAKLPVRNDTRPALGKAEKPTLLQAHPQEVAQHQRRM